MLFGGIIAGYFRNNAKRIGRVGEEHSLVMLK
jgi:hypothetical protein